MALAYACHVMKKPETETYAENIKQAFDDYQGILRLPKGTTLPDPFKITDGWIGEGNDDGMTHWPPITIVDIVDHFREQHINSDKLLSEYKAGKAYDYFKTEWLKEIFYKAIDEPWNINYPGTERYCFLKAKCTPLQRLNDTYHDVWIAVAKDTGRIACGYCNCAAG